MHTIKNIFDVNNGLIRLNMKKIIKIHRGGNRTFTVGL